MFVKTTLENDVYGIVGLRQPNNPAYAVLDADNIASTSGYFVTDLPLVKVEFFKDSQDYDAISDAAFNTLLADIQKSAITSVCNLVFNTEDFIDRNLFYKNANNNVDAEVLDDGFVGFRLELANKKNIAFEITRVVLDFQSQFSDITLYLFNTGDPNPIQTKVITISEQHQVEELGWVVDNTGDTYKGDFYIGYNKDGSSPIPFKRDYQNANVLSTISDVHIFPTQVKGHATGVLFDLDDEDGLSENIGVNPDILIYNDYTDFIIQNKRLFATAIYLQMGIFLINETISSLRSNRNQRIGDDVIVRMIQTLDGVDAESGKLKIVGLKSQLTGEIKQLKREVQKLILGYEGGRLQVETLT